MLDFELFLPNPTKHPVMLRTKLSTWCGNGIPKVEVHAHGVDAGSLLSLQE